MQHDELYDNVERLSSRVDQVIDTLSKLTSGSDADNGSSRGCYSAGGSCRSTSFPRRATSPGPTTSLPLTESLFERLLQQIVKGQHTRPDLGLDSDEARELLDTTPDIAVELDHDGRVLYANASFSVPSGIRTPTSSGPLL